MSRASHRTVPAAKSEGGPPAYNPAPAAAADVNVYTAVAHLPLARAVSILTGAREALVQANTEVLDALLTHGSEPMHCELLNAMRGNRGAQLDLDEALDLLRGAA